MVRVLITGERSFLVLTTGGPSYSPPVVLYSPLLVRTHYLVTPRTHHRWTRTHHRWSRTCHQVALVLRWYFGHICVRWVLSVEALSIHLDPVCPQQPKYPHSDRRMPGMARFGANAAFTDRRGIARRFFFSLTYVGGNWVVEGQKCQKLIVLTFFCHLSQLKNGS